VLDVLLREINWMEKKKKNNREAYHSQSIMQVHYCHFLEEMLGKALQ
jgi:hypothetical protein